MEFGARALGNRSILARADNPQAVRVINDMVKNRDFWMPFAPAVLAERAKDYYIKPKPIARSSYDRRVRLPAGNPTQDLCLPAPLRLLS